MRKRKEEPRRIHSRRASVALSPPEHPDSEVAVQEPKGCVQMAEGKPESTSDIVLLHLFHTF